MGFLSKVLSNTRRPEGFWGKMIVRGMNGGHAKVSDWGMASLSGVSAHDLIEIGCGGGRNAAELMKRYPDAHMTAVDYSPVSVEQSKLTLADAVREGRCDVLEANVLHLPFQGGAFDLATAFETVYFWPGLNECFAEVCRVLKPSGHFLIVLESDGEDAAGKKYEKIIDGMKVYTAPQLEAALKQAGFSKVDIRRGDGKPWLALLAEK